ncbi:unnamed protein product [Notodromas monacha]|uniref:Uncharacterized protein n=1 Tax=Notodromas monacha TaxID=399045 RepID=A0A7R9BR74_9CRUS|nr:unnamed protein product [Notodromas monacha]CAG0920191.1 unnamed protein product [Notodromas monacha]
MGDDGVFTVVSAEEKLDCIIFGVTGVIGSHVLLEFGKRCFVENSLDLSFGIAARSATGIQDALDNLAEAIDQDVEIPDFVADVENPESMEIMVRSTKVLINCTAPGYASTLQTWNSMIEELSRYSLREMMMSALRGNGSQLAPSSTQEAASVTTLVSQFPLVSGWALPLSFIQTSSYARTQEYLADHGMVPFKCVIKSHFVTSSIPRAVLAFAWLFFIFFMTRLRITVHILRWFANVFACGRFPSKGPTESQMKNAKFEQLIIGYGSVDPRVKKSQHLQTQNPFRIANKIRTVTISGDDPIFGTTAICVTSCAETLIKEPMRLSSCKTSLCHPAVQEDIAAASQLETVTFHLALPISDRMSSPCKCEPSRDPETSQKHQWTDNNIVEIPITASTKKAAMQCQALET